MTTYLIDAVRAPRGKGREGGGLNSLRPVDILKQLFDALAVRTAYDALVNGSGDSCALAMAYKAVCDALDIRSVEPGKRFVKDCDFRVVCQRHEQIEPLFLAA